MSASQLPATAVNTGGQAAVSGALFTETSSLSPGGDVQMEDVFGKDGEFIVRLVYEKRMDKIQATAVLGPGGSLSYSAGEIASIGGQSYYIDKATISYSKGATKVDIEGTKISF
jgi:hypothetical protein